MGKDMTVSRLKQAIENVFAEDSETVCELMVHPGYKSILGCGGCGEGPDLFACSDDREHELNTLKSPTLKEYLKSKNVRVCSFQELNIRSDTCLNPLTPMSDQDWISPYNFETTLKQTSDENKEKYQLGNYQLIQYQILQTTSWELYGRQ